MIELHSATHTLTELLRNVSAAQLSSPTPCSEFTLAALIDHVSGLSLAFAATATKDLGDITAQAPEPDADRLEPDWQERIARQLAGLAAAWDDPAAWTGMSQVGGVTAPAEALGGFALNEIVVHGWDVAKATGQMLHLEPPVLAYAVEFAVATTSEDDNTPFGPPVPVPAGAPLIDRLVGMRGRDPGWQPPAV